MGSKVIGPLLKLSIAATAMGMALVVLSITSGKGLQHAIMDKFRALEGDFTIQAYSLNRTEEWRPIALEDSLFTELAKAPYVDQIFPVVQKASLLVNPSEDVFEGVQIQGFTTITSSTFKNRSPPKELASTVDTDAGSRVTLASSLQLEIGDTAVLTVLKGQRGLPRLINTKIYGTYTSGLDEFDRQNVLMSAWTFVD
jgi:lipoprotein-releasing system permease protein